MIALTRVLRAAALVFTVIGLALLVLPPSFATPAAPAGVSPPHAARAGPRVTPPTLLSLQAIVAANVFSAERKAPSTRYTPPELAVTKPAPPPQRPKPAPPAAPRIRFFGTVIGPGGATAVIEADSTVEGAEIYRIGDRVAGSRLIDISETAVMLDGPSGRQVLRLGTRGRKAP